MRAHVYVCVPLCMHIIKLCMYVPSRARIFVCTECEALCSDETNALQRDNYLDNIELFISVTREELTRALDSLNKIIDEVLVA